MSLRVLLAGSFIALALHAAEWHSSLRNQSPVCRGGPDGYGYVYQSSQDPGDTVHYQWLDATSGTLVSDWTPNPDDGYVALDLPFPFPFYGETLHTINVCSNGFLESSTTTLYENTSLPNADITNLIAPFWDDLSLPRGGAVYVDIGPENSYFVIAFINVARYDPPHDLQTFQVVLYPSGNIRFNYRNTWGNRASNTVGIQGQDGANEYYLEYVANGVPVQHIVRDTMSILFARVVHEHDVGVSDVRSPGGFMAPGPSQPVLARVRNYGTNPESFAVRGVIINTVPPYDTIWSAVPAYVSDLGPRETLLVDLGPFAPGHEGTWLVKLFTELGPDQERSNDTARRTTTNSAPFGTLLGTWDLDLGIGFALAGITFCPDSDRFYLAALEPNRVLSLAPCDPTGTLRLEPFELQNFFGNDVVWGIAYDERRHSFWLGHVEGSGGGTMIARYTRDGSFTGDTWNLAQVEANGWFAGLDYDPAQDRFFITRVGGTNRIYKLDFAGRQVLGFIPEGPASYRACCYFGPCWLFTGGWNQNRLYRQDTLGATNAEMVLDSLADCDLYRPRNPAPDSLVYLLATLSNNRNTLCRVSLGTTWRGLGLREQRARTGADLTLACPSPQANPIRLTLFLPKPNDIRIVIWDLAGRCVLEQGPISCPSGPARLTVSQQLPPGAYFLVVHSQHAVPAHKLVVVR